MHGILLTIYDIAAWHMPDADEQMGGGSSDPYVMFEVHLGSGVHSGKTCTVQNGERNARWTDDVRIMLPGPLALADLNGARLRVTVWDEDEGGADGLMGSVSEHINILGCDQLRRTMIGEGKLYAFEVSFSYEFTPWDKARLRWSDPEVPYNVRVSNRSLTVTRLRWHGAVGGVAFVTASPMLSGQQDATLSFRVYHPNGGRHMYIGIVGAASFAEVAARRKAKSRGEVLVGEPDMVGHVVLLNLYSGRCFSGKSADMHSRMLSGHLDANSCRELEGQLLGVLVRMRVDLSTRRLFFAVGNRADKWVEAGARLPKVLRPCAILGDDEGAFINFEDNVISTQAEMEAESGPISPLWKAASTPTLSPQNGTVFMTRRGSDRAAG